MSKPYCCGSAEVPTYIPAPYVIFLNSGLKASEDTETPSAFLAFATEQNSQNSHQPDSLIAAFKIAVQLVKLNL